jgi:hypothetical protein
MHTLEIKLLRKECLFLLRLDNGYFDKMTAGTLYDKGWESLVWEVKFQSLCTQTLFIIYFL